MCMSCVMEWNFLEFYQYHIMLQTLEEALQVMDSINLGEITSVCFFFFYPFNTKITSIVVMRLGTLTVKLLDPLQASCIL